jgi:hypothetical protein
MQQRVEFDDLRPCSRALLPQRADLGDRQRSTSAVS